MDEKEIQNLVNQFLTSYEAGSIVSNGDGLEQVQENARQCTLSASLERDSYSWWSSLPENVKKSGLPIQRRQRYARPGKKAKGAAKH